MFEYLRQNQPHGTKTTRKQSGPLQHLKSNRYNVVQHWDLYKDGCIMIGFLTNSSIPFCKMSTLYHTTIYNNFKLLLFYFNKNVQSVQTCSALCFKITLQFVTKQVNFVKSFYQCFSFGIVSFFYFNVTFNISFIGLLESTHLKKNNFNKIKGLTNISVLW